VFLCSAVDGLRDTRMTFLENLERRCTHKITLVSYEKDSRRYPTLSPEDICIRLVQECNALIVVIDQFYGTRLKKNPNISITHAEVMKALELRLTIIPIVRFQTFHEFKVWRRNRDKKIQFDHVKESGLFKIMDLLYKDYNFNCYDSFVAEKTLIEVGSIIDAIVEQGAVGRIDSTSLPGEKRTVKHVTEPESVNVQRSGIPLFQAGEVLRAEQLNSLYALIVKKASEHGLTMQPSIIWSERTILHAQELNNMLNDIDKIYRHIGKQPPTWSFGRFQPRRVLHSSQLNEIIEGVSNL
jgi:hypothetical protein